MMDFPIIPIAAVLVYITVTLARAVLTPPETPATKVYDWDQDEEASAA